MFSWIIFIIVIVVMTFFGLGWIPFENAIIVILGAGVMGLTDIMQDVKKQ